MNATREPPSNATRLSRMGSEAVALLETMQKSLETVRQVFGESHRYYADSLDHYARALEAAGDTNVARETSARAVEIRRSIAGREDHTGGDSAQKPRSAAGTDFQSRVLDAQGAARYLSLGLDTLYRLVRSGELPHSRVGKSIRFRPEDLDEYIAARVTREWTRVDRRGRPKRPQAEKRSSA